MTTRDRVRRLAEVLPDVLPDAELDTAARILEALAGGALDPAARAALFAPEDDEPLTDAERAGMAESRAALAAGNVEDLDALRAALGSTSEGAPAAGVPAAAERA